MLTLTPKHQHWKKVKKNWSHELKCASTTTKMKSCQGESQAKNHWVGTADVNIITAMLPYDGAA